MLSFVAKNSIRLGITWERIADTLEHFMDMGNLAQDIRRKFTAADQRTEEGLYLTFSNQIFPELHEELHILAVLALNTRPTFSETNSF